MTKILFITGTGTDVGKTVATLVLGHLLTDQGLDVGVMKPIQCAGHDADFLKRQLNLKEPIETINPYFAPEPLFPHLAFQRKGQAVNVNKILKTARSLSQQHDLLLVEGAGGLMVPIKKNYFMLDLIEDLEAEVVIISMPGLGTLNHTFLTLEQCRQRGLSVKGVLFNQKDRTASGLSEKTNPNAVKSFGKVEVLGTIPFLTKFDKASVLRKCRWRVNSILLQKTSSKNFQRTKQFQQKDKQYIWHPFTQMKDWLEEDPLVIQSGQGSFLTDTRGQSYLDGVSSLWVNLHGHRHKTIDAALKDQITRMCHSTLLGLTNPPAIELAKVLVDITPRGLDKVFYSDSGSTAVEIGIKMAYQYWQNRGQVKKRRLVHLANSYHGDTLGSVSVGGTELYHKAYRDLVIPTIQIEFPDCYRAPLGKSYPDYVFECLDNMEEVFRRKNEDIAAMIIEPLVQAASGIIIWPEGALKIMASLCKKYNIILIADEVATGFGRTGKMFACEHEAVAPDILCLAKGITAGYLPLAATLTSQEIFNGFVFPYKDQKTFFHGHTYTGNPLCCAAALANLMIFHQEHTLRKLSPKIRHLSRRLEDFYKLPKVGDVRQKGLMVGIELVRNRETKEPYDWDDKIGVQVCQKVRERGVILRPLGNVIVLMPPLSITRRELDLLLDVTYWAIGEVTGAEGKRTKEKGEIKSLYESSK